MAWTPPMTAVANEEFSAAEFNTHIRDNLNETAPAIATSAGGFIMSSGTNTISERPYAVDYDTTQGTRTTTSFGDLSGTDPGPEVTLETGTSALAIWRAESTNDTQGATYWIGVEVSGSTSIAPNGDDSIRRQEDTGDSRELSSTCMHVFTGLNAGTNTFTMKYSPSTGKLTTNHRELFVLALPI